MKPENILPIITVILSLASMIGPAAYGFAIWKMQAIFVTKEVFDAFKAQSTKERGEIKETLAEIVSSIQKIEISLARLEEKSQIHRAR